MGCAVLVFFCACGLLLDTQIWTSGRICTLVLGGLIAITLALQVWDGTLPSLPRPRVPWAFLGQWSRRARKKAGGHWEYRFCPDLFSGGHGWEWRQVPQCHHARACPFGCDYRCGLVRCEHWGSRLDDNAVAAEPDHAWDAVQAQIQRACLAWEQERAEERALREWGRRRP